MSFRSFFVYLLIAVIIVSLARPSAARQELKRLWGRRQSLLRLLVIVISVYFLYGLYALYRDGWLDTWFSP